MPAPRLFIPQPLKPGLVLALPPNATRHVQVLRLQPGDPLVLFDGLGGQWTAEVQGMGRREATARVLEHQPVERELACAVTLALGMPANERMDTLIEKATELGVAVIQPLLCRRSVLRVAGERAERKAAHWQAIAQSACEQCGRNRVPAVAAPQPLEAWLAGLGPAVEGQARWLLSLDADAAPMTCERRVHPGLDGRVAAAPSVTVLSGPEGGLDADEQSRARARGFGPISLGPRVLRADTAPLAALAVIACADGPAVPAGPAATSEP